MRIPIYVNAVNIFKFNPKIGCCLAARDWKGFGTRWNYMNGALIGGQMNKPEDYAIRRLVPNEYFRLMGMKDEDYEKFADKISDTQKYKIAGNGLSPTVMMYIYAKLFGIEKVPKPIVKDGIFDYE